MGQIEKPLDQEAVAAADAELYGRHGNDPRPNALYDASGNRRPLSPSDPAQAGARAEWRSLYQAHLEKKNGPKKAPPEPAPATDRAPDNPVQPCPDSHWIEVTLKPRPDQRPRPTWWPAATASPYGAEPYAASGACGSKTGKMAAGMSRLSNIPAGTCGFSFPEFYQAIEQLFSQP
jgi:hypothetical protein